MLAVASRTHVLRITKARAVPVVSICTWGRWTNLGGSHIVSSVLVDVAAGERYFASRDVNTSTLPQQKERSENLQFVSMGAMDRFAGLWAAELDSHKTAHTHNIATGQCLAIHRGDGQIWGGSHVSLRTHHTTGHHVSSYPWWQWIGFTAG